MALLINENKSLKEKLKTQSDILNKEKYKTDENVNILNVKEIESKDEIKKIKTNLSSKNYESLFTQKINLIGPLNTIEEAKEISSSKSSVIS